MSQKAAAFTKGPWQAITDPPRKGRNRRGDLMALVRTGSGEAAIDCTRSGENYAEDCANARLIAASPDQNALLIEALDLVPRVSDDDPMSPALLEWCRQAREVVSRARGEETR